MKNIYQKNEPLGVLVLIKMVSLVIATQQK